MPGDMFLTSFKTDEKFQFCTRGSAQVRRQRMLSFFSPARPLELVVIDTLESLLKMNNGNQFVIIITTRYGKLRRKPTTVQCETMFFTVGSCCTESCHIFWLTFGNRFLKPSLRCWGFASDKMTWLRPPFTAKMASTSITAARSWQESDISWWGIGAKWTSIRLTYEYITQTGCVIRLYLLAIILPWETPSTNTFDSLIGILTAKPADTPPRVFVILSGNGYIVWDNEKNG